MTIVRLIKKEDPAESQITKFAPLGGEETAPEVPAWIRAAATAGKHTGSSSHTGSAHLEKAAYENGFRQGEKAGKEITEKKVEAVMRRYADTILEIAKVKPTLYVQAEREVVKLALEVAKKVVHREVQVDREIIQTLVRVALSHVAAKSAVTIHLNPADYSFMLEHRASMARPAENEREIVLLADKSIERGGCLIETECGDIDARIEEEFSEVERAFFSHEG
jgi:flagellar assembly protein FliH